MKYLPSAVAIVCAAVLAIYDHSTAAGWVGFAAVLFHPSSNGE